MYSSLITINKKVYQVKFGILSLITLDKISYIKDEKELLKQRFCLSDVKRADNTSLTYFEKENFFNEFVTDAHCAELLEDVLSEALDLSLGEYSYIDESVYKDLFEKGVGEIRLSLQEFNSMTPAEIDLAYRGYLKRKELEANCVLVAIRKSKDNKASLISLLGGEGYQYISETERKDVLESLNIKE